MELSPSPVARTRQPFGLHIDLNNNPHFSHVSKKLIIKFIRVESLNLGKDYVILRQLISDIKFYSEKNLSSKFNFFLE